MVRCGPWKLIHHYGYPSPQLFNLDNDPWELHDLAGDPACQEQRESLLALAIAGWDGEAIVATVQRRRALRPPPNPAVRPRPLPAADYWPPPPGCNVFPE